MSSPTQASTLYFLSREHGYFYIREKKSVEEEGRMIAIMYSEEKAFGFLNYLNSKCQVPLL